MKSKIPKIIVLVLLMILSLSLSSCRLVDKIDILNFNPMLNYLNLNYIDIYYIQCVDGIPNNNSLAYFDFKENDKSYYKKKKIDDSNEYESQLSKYGILFTEDIYSKRYYKRNDTFKENDKYFYIDISVKNFKVKDLTLSCEGYENIIVTYSDNSLKMYTSKEDVDKWKLDDGKKVKSILIKCKFYDGDSKTPRIEHLEEK